MSTITLFSKHIQDLAALAVQTAKDLGCSYADFRYEVSKSEAIALRNTAVEHVNYHESSGYGIRVIYDHTWGFAAGNGMDTKHVQAMVAQAIAMAKELAKINTIPVALSQEKVFQDEYIAPCADNPFKIPLKDKIAYMMEVNTKLLNSSCVQFADFECDSVEELKYFLSSEGTETSQKRIRMEPIYVITGVDEETGKYDTLRSMSYPVGKGYESMNEFNFLKQAEVSPIHLQEKMHAPSIKPGKYDIVVDPTNLWLVIHESIGHTTELDRVLGYEANYAGTSFATMDKLNTLQYASDIVSVKADRTQSFGLATIGYDDDGVRTKEWYLIKKGLLVDYQYNREIALRYGFTHSNGCAYADSWSSFPIQRMPNVSLEPNEKDLTTPDLIKQVENGIYIIGDNSWSIDMQRYNFQFTGQLFYKITDGKLDGMYRDVAYQSNTIDFWNACSQVGGKSTYVLGGSFVCGKGQPPQVAPVSHGAPSALFRNINILNTQDEN